MKTCGNSINEKNPENLTAGKDLVYLGCQRHDSNTYLHTRTEFRLYKSWSRFSSSDGTVIMVLGRSIIGNYGGGGINSVHR